MMLLLSLGTKLDRVVPPAGLSMWDLRWLLITFSAAVIIFAAVLDLARAQRVHNARLQDIEVMDDRAFVLYLAHLFRRLGYRVHISRKFGGCRTDLLVKGYGTRCIVFSTSSASEVGLRTIQAAARKWRTHDYRLAMVVTKYELGPDAARLAWQNGMEIWGRQALGLQLASAREASIAQARFVVDRTTG